MVSIIRSLPARLPMVLALATTVLVVDQATKAWAEATLADREPISVIGEFLQFRLHYNAGAAFSIGSDSTWLFTIAAAIAVVVLLVVAKRPQSRARAVGVGLMLGGAATHLLDRLFRSPGFAQGHVVDFIDYNGWFVGNVADIALVVGAGLIVLTSIRASDEPADAQQPDDSQKS